MAVLTFRAVLPIDLAYQFFLQGCGGITKTVRENIPFERTYWVIPRQLLAGCYPGRLMEKRAEEKLRNLVACGVRHVINLMEENEVDHSGTPFVPYEKTFQGIALDSGVDVKCERLSIKDRTIPSRKRMRFILDRIDDAIKRRPIVYVHCWGGIGRTGMVVGCYLARHRLAIGEEMLRKIAELRRWDPKAAMPSPWTEAQRKFACSWRPGE